MTGEDRAMRKRLIGIGAAAMLFAAVVTLHAQKATERFIPLGQSPGLSGIATSIGEVEAADAGTQTLTVVAEGRRLTAKITAQTFIWLDRSKLKQTTLTGSFSDLKQGRRVEVKFLDPETRQTAEWVKIEVAQ
jgi:hypothetical protein